MMGTSHKKIMPSPPFIDKEHLLEKKMRHHDNSVFSLNSKVYYIFIILGEMLAKQRLSSDAFS